MNMLTSKLVGPIQVWMVLAAVIVYFCFMH
jgi:hypothetical protein